MYGLMQRAENSNSVHAEPVDIVFLVAIKFIMLSFGAAKLLIFCDI